MDTIASQIVSDSVATIATNEAGGPDLWMIIALVEAAVIVWLLLRNKQTESKTKRIKRQVMNEGDVDFGNIIDSSFHSETLYKQLITKCHPDRFAPDQQKMDQANELSTLITKNRHDKKRLEELKQTAEQTLNITI